jgi:hypothetical protein
MSALQLDHALVLSVIGFASLSDGRVHVFFGDRQLGVIRRVGALQGECRRNVNSYGACFMHWFRTGILTAHPVFDGE